MRRIFYFGFDRSGGFLEEEVLELWSGGGVSIGRLFREESWRGEVG